MPVKPGRDKQPNLVEHKRRSHEHARDKRDLQIHVERVGRVQIHQLLLQLVVAQRLHDRLLHEPENLLVEPPADAESAHDVEEAVDDAAAQLLEVVEEAHAGHLFRAALLGFLDDRARHSGSERPASPEAGRQTSCSALQAMRPHSSVRPRKEAAFAGWNP